MRGASSHSRNSPEDRDDELLTCLAYGTDMSAEFSVIADRARGALRVTMAGFFTPADVEAFAMEVHAKLAQLGLPANQHLMLCDVRKMRIQTQEIVGAFSNIVGHPRFRSKRLAFITGSSLSRLQAKRLGNREGVAYFSDALEGENWLFDDQHSAAIAASA